jgi:hypothetical protein
VSFREELRLSVFENMVLRRIFGPKRDDIIGGLRKLHNGELNNLYSLLSVINMIESRSMRWVVHVTCIGEKRTDTEF